MGVQNLYPSKSTAHQDLLVHQQIQFEPETSPNLYRVIIYFIILNRSKQNSYLKCYTKLQTNKSRGTRMMYGSSMDACEGGDSGHTENQKQ